MSEPQARPPVLLTNVLLLVWAGTVAALTWSFHQAGQDWSPVGFGLAALTALIAAFGLASFRWVEPLFGAMLALALACVVGGAITEVDVWAATGVLGLLVVSVGAVVVHRLGARG